MKALARKALALCLCLTLPAFAADVYVSPSGNSGNSGAIGSPIDLVTACNGVFVDPGDTVWLRGGTYTGTWDCALPGTAGSPIVVRGYTGERAILTDPRVNVIGGSPSSGPTLHVLGSYTTYRDFEITNATTTRETASLPDVFTRPTAIEMQSPNSKLVNLVIHDAGLAIGFWKESTNAEVYGNIIYNTGWLGPDRGHGHGIYAQNDVGTGTKLIKDNIVFNGFGWGLHVYPDPGHISNITMDGNVLFDNGSNPDTDVRHHQILVQSDTGGVDVQGIVITSNYLFNSTTQMFDAGAIGALICLGCDSSVANDDVTITGNYLAGGVPSIWANQWDLITFTGNTLVAPIGDLFPYLVKPGGSQAYSWDNNQYRFTPTFGAYYQDIARNFSTWKSATGLDASSTHQTVAPSTATFVRPNAYQAGRGNVIVYNWDGLSSVNADLSSVLTVGHTYSIVSAVNPFGSVVASGTYTGATVNIPLAAVTPPIAVGYGSALPNVGPEFNIFVVTSEEGSEPAKPVAPTSLSAVPR